MENTLDTYAARLASAMEVADFGGKGGQSQLAREIGCLSQSINQALGGTTLKSLYHVRACIRLGIRPLWLSEGRGLRYDPAGPRIAIPGGDGPFTVPEAWLAGMRAEQGADALVSEGKHADLTWAEQALINKLRSSSRLAGAVTTLVEMADVSRA
jgi:hypothetical protein